MHMEIALLRVGGEST